VCRESRCSRSRRVSRRAQRGPERARVTPMALVPRTVTSRALPHRHVRDLLSRARSDRPRPRRTSTMRDSSSDEYLSDWARRARRFFASSCRPTSCAWRSARIDRRAARTWLDCPLRVRKARKGGGGPAHAPGREVVRARDGPARRGLPRCTGASSAARAHPLRHFDVLLLPLVLAADARLLRLDHAELLNVELLLGLHVDLARLLHGLLPDELDHLLNLLLHLILVHRARVWGARDRWSRREPKMDPGQSSGPTFTPVFLQVHRICMSG